MPDTPIAVWINAIRPRTLPLASASILLAGGLAWADGVFDGIILLLSLVTALMLQILSNLANDYGDARAGADNSDRRGPLRAVQSGAVSARQMLTAIVFSGLLATALGLGLLGYVFAGDWLGLLGYMGLGMLALAAAVTYTMGRSPYGYRGLGDLSVFLFFGWLGVLGSYYLYAGQLYLELLLPASSCGLLSAAVLNINNIRDLSSDRAAGKLTLAVRLGRRRAVAYHWGLVLTAILATISFVDGRASGILAWGFVLLVPGLLSCAMVLERRRDPQVINHQLKLTALGSFGFCALLGLGVALG